MNSHRTSNTKPCQAASFVILGQVIANTLNEFCFFAVRNILFLAKEFSDGFVAILIWFCCECIALWHYSCSDKGYGTSNLLKLENLLRFTRLEDFFKYRVHSTYTWSTQVHSYGLQLKFLLRLSNHCHGTYCNKQITTICPSPLSECVFCYLQHDHAEPGAARSFWILICRLAIAPANLSARKVGHKFASELILAMREASQSTLHLK